MILLPCSHTAVPSVYVLLVLAVLPETNALAILVDPIRAMMASIVRLGTPRGLFVFAVCPDD